MYTKSRIYFGNRFGSRNDAHGLDGIRQFGDFLRWAGDQMAIPSFRIAETRDPRKVTVEVWHTFTSGDHRLFLSTYAETGADAHRILEVLGDIADEWGMPSIDDLPDDAEVYEGIGHEGDPLGALTMRLAETFGWFA